MNEDHVAYMDLDTSQRSILHNEDQNEKRDLEASIASHELFFPVS
jgi:hypothetical protein